VAHALEATWKIPHDVTGLVMAAATAVVLLGGIRGIGRAASALVPAMIFFYMAGALSVILSHPERVPQALALVMTHAFTPIAAAGGFTGATVAAAVQKGIARGVFSNESGLGSAAMAAAAAQTPNPVSQALVSMTQTFIDTLVVCTLTGLAILTSGAWTSGRDGAALTALAFSSGPLHEAGGAVVSAGLALFAYSTLLGWSYYGEKAVEYLLGSASVTPYRLLWIACIVLGARVDLDLVWKLADLMNGLMALPNLVGLLALSGEIRRETVRHLGTFLAEVRGRG